MNLEKTYDPKAEDGIYQNWLDKGYFHAAPNPSKTPFTIVIPPPNITDQLHMGHALNNTIQDILIRFKRMQGYEALWMPGTDHAAISTEVILVRELAKEGLDKKTLGREAFIKRAWAWKDKYSSRIISQLKKLGSSCDWERERFTLDDGLSGAVLEMFTRLYAEGAVYRGERLVNWCVKCRTSISDAEVEHEDRDALLYYFKYPVKGSGEYIAFATTRPETMLGDTAVAVNPEDARYGRLIGETAVVPSTGREIPIIADAFVDPAFGTGAVKITPAHDPNDFEAGERHNLPRINILNDDGTINENGGRYAGMTRERAREAIIEEMAGQGLYIKSEKLAHAVGTHDRCHEVVEPMLKLQWFVKMKELARPAIDAYKNGELRFNRERFGRVYLHWLENIKDWCVSRQLWWGHRIPAWYCEHGHITVAKETPAACSTCGSAELTRDEDTLDTWFSSALWPFSTLGWPERTPELDYFYPTNVLVTAYEIIFFWVVRMVFSGIKFMGRLPFSDVFITGLVRDADGVKMSKSLGNGIDPLEVIDKYGADALRLMLVTGNALDNDTRFHWERMEHSRNFLNKLWNAARFALMNIGDNPIATPDGADFTAEDRWLLSLLHTLVADVTKKLDEFELGLAAQKITDFLWDEFCDWYIEMVKPRLYGDKTCPAYNAALWTLREALITAVKLLHPFAPFVTETLFLSLQSGEETVMRSAWPVSDAAFYAPAAEREVERVKEAVRAARNIRAERAVPPSKKIKLYIMPQDADSAALFAAGAKAAAFLAGASDVEIIEPAAARPESAVSAVIPGAVLFVPLDDLIDREQERARLIKERERLTRELSRADAKLANEGFTAKAPEAVVAEEREKRERFAAMLAKVEEQLS